MKVGAIVSHAQDDETGQFTIVERPAPIVDVESVGDNTEAILVEPQDVVMQDIEGNVADIIRATGATEVVPPQADHASDPDRPLVSPPLTERSRRTGKSMTSATPDLEEIKANFEALLVPGPSEPPEDLQNASESALVINSVEGVGRSESPEDIQDASESALVINSIEVTLGSSEPLENIQDASELVPVIDSVKFMQETEMEPVAGSLEANRRQRAKDFDPSLLDSYLKPLDSHATDKPPVIEIWGHIDPRAAWSKLREKEWVEDKIKEIAARGGRKANFGKKLTSQIIKERLGNGWDLHQDKPVDIDERPEWREDTETLERIYGVKDMDELVPGLINYNGSKKPIFAMQERPIDETGKPRKRTKTYPMP